MHPRPTLEERWMSKPREEDKMGLLLVLMMPIVMIVTGVLRMYLVGLVTF